jgi:hypothetical protein
VNRGQPQSPTAWFGTKEWFEDSSLDVFGHARACIDDFDGPDAGAGIRRFDSRIQRNASWPIAKGLARIGEQIRSHEPQLRWVDFYEHRRVGQSRFGCHRIR